MRARCVRRSAFGGDMTKGRLPTRIGLCIAAAALFSCSAAAADAGVTAAVVDLDRTAIGGALEAELLRAPEIRWVERNRLDLIAKEKNLPAAFSPEGGAARHDLGKLLSADSLV